MAVERGSNMTEHTYYQTIKEANDKRQRREGVFYEPDKGYYIVPRRKNIWDIFDEERTNMATETIQERMDKEKKISCPKCGIIMDKLTNGRYIIDKCPKCNGVYLDAGEVYTAGKQGFIAYILDYFRRDKK